MVEFGRLGDRHTATAIARSMLAKGASLAAATRALEAQARTHAKTARAGHQHTIAVAEDVPWRFVRVR
jgi:hypothetical protein